MCAFLSFILMKKKIYYKWRTMEDKKNENEHFCLKNKINSMNFFRAVQCVGAHYSVKCRLQCKINIKLIIKSSDSKMYWMGIFNARN